MNHNEFIAFDGTSKQPLTMPAEKRPVEPNDEVFDWLNDSLQQSSYFCIVNTNRKPVLAGEQAPMSYGSCTNKYWLQTYGFALVDSPYNAVLIYL